MGAPRRRTQVRRAGLRSALLLGFVLANPAMAAIIPVNTTEDLPIPANNSNCSLREAIEAIRTAAQVDLCPAAGTDENTIDLAAITGTISLSAELVIDNRDVTIIGPGARNLTISGNDVVGVVRVRAAKDLILKGVTIARGRRDDGGGITNNGQLTVEETSFVANFAQNDGGAIVNNGTMTVLNSTFSGNGADQEGGAIVNFGDAMIANSTFSGNMAGLANGGPGNSGGGAIFNSDVNITGAPAPMTVINSTVAGNSNNGSGGGIATEFGSTITLRNTLIAANVGAGGGSDNCIVEASGGAIVDGGGNLDDGATCGFSLSNATAGLAAGLQNNGGPTDTIALTAGSDAIDMGVNDVCAAPPVSNLDQRGVSRPIDGDGDGNAVCDIGAFESSANPPPPPPPPPSPPPPPPPPGDGPAPRCSGRTANIFVRDGFIVGGPNNGQQYTGRLRGTARADVMVGTPGNDILVGSRGNDRICGGGGNDDLRGGAGNDRLFGQAGRDRLSGGTGSDRCSGGPGRDTIRSCE
jgi:CSLREA domain-containing protein